MTSHPFGTGWRFRPGPADRDLPEFDDSGFAEVTLPHTVVPLSWRDWDPSAWERVWMYRKRFDAPPGADGRRVFLDFAAAMTRATVTVNGAEVADHLGGYLPFSVEMTGLLRPGGNVLAVRLDSVAIGGPGRVTVTATLSGLQDVRLWDIDDPAL
jgi:beta-galactosidase